MNNTDNYTDTKQRIGALENLDDWKVHSDDVDVRGWNLYAGTGEKIGKVENLIADTEAKKVRYLEVELDDNLSSLRTDAYRNTLTDSYRNYYGTDKDNHILIPIGVVDIDENDNKVVASSNLNNTYFANSPRYQGIRSTQITPAHELTTLKYYADHDDYYRESFEKDNYDIDTFATASTISDNRFYGSDFFSRSNYGRRFKRTPNTMASFNTGGPQL